MNNPALLEIGALSATKRTLFKAADGEFVVLRAILFHNTGAGARTVSVFINRGGTSTQLTATNVAASGTLVIEEGWVLNSTDALEAVQAAGTDVNFAVFGASGTEE